MRFERVRLRHFKCYDDADLSLRDGVTVIHGVNGSGKSSLLEACFFALYGADAIDGTLDEVISNDAEEMAVELWFTHAGGDYHVEREVKLRSGTAQTTTCVLETPDGTVEQVTDVESRIASLLRMDAEAFVNCAYVRQGEVNKLINAAPSERQDMIDDLLQLGTLEEYRERASDARVGVGRVRDDKQGALSQVVEQIEAKEEKDLHDRLNRLRSELTEVDAEIEDKRENRDAAQETLENAESVIEEYEARREEIAELDDEIDELTETIAATEREREDLGDRIAALREDVEALEDDLEAAVAETDLEAADREAVEARLEELDDEADDLQERIKEQSVTAQEHAGTAETKRERAAELREEAAERREEADELEADLEDEREALAERRETLDELDGEIDALRSTLADAPIDRDDVDAHRESVEAEVTEAREHVAELRAELENARNRVAEAERLLEEGKCPECGQPVDGSPHVSSLDEDRERVAELESELESAEERVADLEAKRDRADELVETEAELSRKAESRESLAELIEQKAGTLAEQADRVDSLREAAADAEAAADEAETAADEAESKAEAARETVGELNTEKGTLRDRRGRVERVADLLEEIDERERDVETLRDRRETKAEVNDERRERLAEKRDRKSELETEFDQGALEEATAEKERAEEYLAEVEPYLEDKRAERDDLQSRIGAVENELEELAALRDRRDELEAVVDRLDSLYREVRELQETYADLRAELRQRNVETLEAMLNETFQLVYENDSYARIELDGDYELTVYQKDGTPLDPEQLSGGERALFNLSLRCAIYRLLSEGIEGQAPTPPLILDEPTVFLDSGHVSKLVELVESMTEHGVDQIVVVSHDEELVGAADDLVAVRKDPTTNRSTVERSGTVEALT